MSAALTIQIGEAAYKGRLPHMRHRFELWLAWRRALGFLPEDDANPDADGMVTPSGIVDGDDTIMIALAAVGLCWADDPLDGVPSYRIIRRRVRRDAEAAGVEVDEDAALLELGECVYDALYGDHAPQHIYDAGSQLIGEVLKSIPTKAEVDESAVPFKAPAESFTGST